MKYLICAMMALSSVCHADNTEYWKQINLSYKCIKAIRAGQYQGGVERCDEVAEIMQHETDTAQILRAIAKRHNLVYVEPAREQYVEAPAPAMKVYNTYKSHDGTVITSGPGIMIFDTSNRKK